MSENAEVALLPAHQCAPLATNVPLCISPGCIDLTHTDLSTSLLAQESIVCRNSVNAGYRVMVSYKDHLAQTDGQIWHPQPGLGNLRVWPLRGKAGCFRSSQ